MALIRDEEKEVAPMKAQGQNLRNAKVVFGWEGLHLFKSLIK